MPTRNKLRVIFQGRKCERVLVEWLRSDRDVPQATRAVRFRNPFKTKKFEHIVKEYLEEEGRPDENQMTKSYIERNERYSAIMRKWGEQLFNGIFGEHNKSGSFLFAAATKKGIKSCALVISCDSSKYLSLPWELIYSPKHNYLALTMHGLYRSLNKVPINKPLKNHSPQYLNILFVVARPVDGKWPTIRERSVVKAVLETPQMQKLMKQRRLAFTVLRPPSFEAFEKELRKKEGFYHIVHFDGHGDKRGLVFEDLTRSSKQVSGDLIARTLQDCRVSAFVLNACESGRPRDHAMSSVASQLIGLGSHAVVSMAFIVKVKTATIFMAKFYQKVAEGRSISFAVTAGRRKLRKQLGVLSPSHDWIVPTLYQQNNFIPVRRLKDRSESSRHQVSGEVSTGNFLTFGRESERSIIALTDDKSWESKNREVEHTFRKTNIVVLTGNKKGSTERAKFSCAWASWIVQTNGREGECFISLRSPALAQDSLRQILRTIAKHFFPSDLRNFERLTLKNYQKRIIKHVRSRWFLLIWDGFDCLRKESEGYDEIISFLKDVQGGRTWVLITSATEEEDKGKLSWWGSEFPFRHSKIWML